MNATPPTDQRPHTIWDTIKSVAAAFFGVQSSRNREHDFTRGKPSHYLVIGVGMTLLFVLAVITVVRLILRSAGV